MKISCGKGLEKIWGLGSDTRGDVEGLGKLGGLEEKQPREHTTSGNVDHPVLTAGGFSRAQIHREGVVVSSLYGEELALQVRQARLQRSHQRHLSRLPNT